MWFVLIGVAMLVMNFVGFGPIGEWTWREDWWLMLLPFACAVAWWTWSDMTGMTQRKAMAKEDLKRDNRRDESLSKLGLGPKGKKKR